MKKLIFFSCLALALVQGGAPTSGTTHCPGSGVLSILSTPKKAVTYTVQAPITNTGQVCLGGPNISTTTGVCLQIGGSDTKNPQGNAAAYDLSTVYMACSATGDSVTWSYQ